MPHVDPAKHAAYVYAWLHDSEHPERLEQKRQRDRERYEENRDRELVKRREYYQRNREKVLARTRRAKEEVRAFVAAARQNPCVDCGGGFPPVVMHFHHVDPEMKKMEVPQASTLAQAKTEMAKCVLVCANCHALRHGA